MKATQSLFHPMWGHVADGCRVTGDFTGELTIKADMRGWTVVDPSGASLGTGLGAYQVAAIVENYRGPQ